jgi:hypothetical protein
VLVSFRENHCRGLADHHTVALQQAGGTPSGPITYTTRGDATSGSHVEGSICTDHRRQLLTVYGVPNRQLVSLTCWQLDCRHRGHCR